MLGIVLKVQNHNVSKSFILANDMIMIIRYYQMGLGCVCFVLHFQVYESNEYLPIKMSLLLLLHIGGP